MAHIEDRWYKVMRHPDGRRERVKTELFGKGLRYRVRYVGPDGREHKKSFPDRAKRDAEAFLVSTETDKLRGSYIDPTAGRLTFRVYAEEWLRTRSFDESTRETTEFRVRKHLLPFFGDRQLAAIKPGHVREWDRSMVGVLAPATRAVVFAHLRTILGAAVDDERIAKNPCSAKSVTPPRPVVRRVVPWKLDTVSAIRQGLAERYRPSVDLGAGCGMRQGEIFGLSPDDVDFDGGWIHVVRQVKIVRYRLVLGLPKNDRDRRIPLPASVATVLRAHFDAFPPVEVTLPWEDPASDEKVTLRLALTTTRRNVIKRNTFDEKNWRPALIAAGLAPSRSTGMHALRHFYASALLDAGESIKALATYLGHSDPGFTLRVYTHLMPASEERTRHAIDDLFAPAPEVDNLPDDGEEQA
ncbi:tyrosine-type recombinase/integrase [Micromonospora sp. NPDC004704]